MPLVVACAAIISGLTLAALLNFRRRPFLAMGWAWFLIALIPVIGIVRVGNQAYADRYTYLPHAGLLLAVVWGVYSLSEGRPAVKKPLVILAGTLMIVFVLRSQRQTAIWKDSISLFSHAVSVTRDNALARLNLGQALERAGRRQEAVEHLEEALRQEPNDHMAYFNLGVTLWNMGQQTRAEAAYREALRLWPGFAEARYNLGTILMRMSRDDEAAAQLTEAIRLRPQFPEACLNLGVIFMNHGDPEKARDLFQRTLLLDPASSAARANLASLPPAGTRHPR